jgi:hypothetical protein
MMRTEEKFAASINKQSKTMEPTIAQNSALYLTQHKRTSSEYSRPARILSPLTLENPKSGKALDNLRPPQRYYADNSR